MKRIGSIIIFLLVIISLFSVISYGQRTRISDLIPIPIDPGPGDVCILFDAFWVLDDVILLDGDIVEEGEVVELVIIGQFCQEDEVFIDIIERDTFGDDFPHTEEGIQISPVPNPAPFGDAFTSSWVVERPDDRGEFPFLLSDAELYFVAAVVGDEREFRESAEILVVIALEDGDGDGIPDEVDDCLNTDPDEVDFVDEFGCFFDDGSCRLINGRWFLADSAGGSLSENEIIISGTQLKLGIRHINCVPSDVDDIEIYEINSEEEGGDIRITSLAAVLRQTEPGIIYVGWTSSIRSFDEDPVSEYYFVVTPTSTSQDIIISTITLVDEDGDGDRVPDFLDDCLDVPGLGSNGCPGEPGEEGPASYFDGICEDGFVGDNRQGQDTGVDKGERYVPGLYEDCRRCVTTVPPLCNDGRDGAVGVGGELDFGEDELNCADCAISGGEAIEDQDGDGVPDNVDQCYTFPVGTQGVERNPSHPYYGCKTNDWDEDGVANNADQCDNTPPGVIVDPSGCSPGDDDEDGVANGFDHCQGTPPGDVPFVIRTVGDPNRGCPSTDLDGDGYYDDVNDDCPGSPFGVPVDERGCSTGGGPGDGVTGCLDGITTFVDQASCHEVSARDTTDPAGGALARCSVNEVATSITIKNFADLGSNVGDIMVYCCKVRSECI